MDQKKEHDVDVQASKVLSGLRELGNLLDEPETGEALDLARNARTTEQYNILRRLRQSLTQYLERDGDLFYVGLVGHFSSIRHESVNNELLGKVVIADTPGSGDTQFVEEVARDFLPICDVILFFFSATSPLDKTDLPLLTEIHKRLRFIPIRFVVTRADEFRVDASKPISDSNIDSVKRDRFLGDVLTRLNKLLHPTVYTEEQFILIDNKAPRYNIDKIIELIRTKCDPESPSARIIMHGHKLHYFQSTAKELKSFFANFIDEKLRQLSTIVSTAEQNIQLYNENVLISNSNLTKNWLDQLSSIRATRERTLKSLIIADPLPPKADDFDTVSKRRAEVLKSLFNEGHFFAREVGLRVKLEISRNLRGRVEQLKLWELGSSNQVPSDVASSLFEVGSDSLLPLIPSSIAGDWASLRDAKAHAVREAAAGLRRSAGEVATLIEGRTPVKECETEVNNAQHSLTLDLNQFFRNAELYRDGVFSHTTKESISTLGIGARLDALESEFTKNDKMSFIGETMQTLFPDFNEISAKGLTNFAALEKDVRPLIVDLNDLKIPSPVAGSRDVGPIKDSVESELLDSIGNQLRDDVGHLGSRINIQLSGAIAEGNRQYETDISTARRRRQARYAAIILGAATVVFIGYLFYRFLNRDVPQDIFNSVIWNLAAETIADSNLSNKLVESYRSVIDNDPDGWNQIVAERMEVIRKYDTEYRRLRREYERNMEEVFEHTSSYFSDASKNLQRLNEVAARVKARAIEPSFELLASTRESLNEVKKQIQAIEFSV